MNLKCPYCGFDELDADFAACPDCGEELNACPGCGKFVKATFKTCPYCRTPLAGSTPDQLATGGAATPEPPSGHPAADPVRLTPDQEASQVLLAPGRRLDSCEIVRFIGQGAMGVVYEVIDHSLDEPVRRAIKTVPHLLASSAKAVRDLKREVRIAQELSHPHIVKTYSLHEAQGVVFLVMERVEGQDLGTWLDEQPEGRASVEQVVDLLQGVAEALDHAHSKQPPVIHRDLKPANLLLDRRDTRLKITDFGLAREVKDIMGSMSTAHVSSGTPAYMPYEQVMGDKPAPTMDIYALGVIAYQALAGELPFSRGDIVLQHRDKKPPAIEGLDTGAMAALWKALAKDPLARYPSASAFIEALQTGEVEHAEQPDAGAPSTVFKAAPPPDAAAAQEAATEETARPSVDTSGNSDLARAAVWLQALLDGHEQEQMDRISEIDRDLLTINRELETVQGELKAMERDENGNG